MSRIGDVIGARFGWAMVTELLQLVSSAVLFLLLATVFDPEVIGELGAVQALAMNALSLANLGTHLLLVGRVSRDHDLAAAWSRSLMMGLISTGTWVLILIMVRGWVAPDIDPWVYALLVAANLMFFWVAELAVFLAIGAGQLRRAAEMRAILVLLRMGALIAFVSLVDRTLRNWAWFSAGSMLLGAVASVAYVRARFGVTPSLSHFRPSDAREGLPYAVSGGSESTVDQSDRWMLESFGHSFDAGVYNTGGRIVRFGQLPIRVLTRSFDAELFRAGQSGLSATLAVSRRMAPTGVVLGLGASIGLWVIAPLMPIIFGDDWVEAEAVIRLLAPLPTIRSVQFILGNSLTAAGLQWWRFGAITAAMVTNVGLNLIYLPTGSWRTAVYTTFVSEAVLVVSLIVVIWWLVTTGRAERAEPGPST